MKQYSFIQEGWKSHIADLSPQSVNRIRAAGMLPTAKQYAKGLNKGTANIRRSVAKKLGGPIVNKNVHDASKIFALPNVGFTKSDNRTSYTFLPKNPDHTRALTKPFSKSKNEFSARTKIPLAVFKGNSDLLDATLRRHETEELNSVANMISRGPKTSQYNKGVNSAMLKYIGTGAVTNGHASGHFPGVLAKEKKITDMTKKAYGTGIYRSPQELSMPFNVSDPKQLRGLKRAIKQDSDASLTPRMKTGIRKHMDTKAPEQFKDTIKTLTSPGVLLQ